MTLLRTSILGVAAISLAACGQSDKPAKATADAKSEQAFFTALITDAPAVTAPESAPDIASAFDGLPAGFRVEMDDVLVNETTGAVQAKNFAFLYTYEGIDVGVRAEAAQFYDFDPSALAARIKGQNLDQSAKVATRIQLDRVKSVGLTEMYTAMMDTYVDVVTDNADLGDEFETEFTEAMDMTINAYDVSIETLVVDNLVLEPFVVGALDDADMSENDAEMAKVFQAIGAGARSFSVDALVYKDMALTFDMEQMDSAFTMDMKIPLTGLRDYKRGDMAYSASWDATFEGALPFPDMAQIETSDEPVFKTLPMKGGIELSAMSDMRLSKAFEALSNWDMPDASDTDFMSIGRYVMQNYQFDFDGQRVFNADLIDLDLRDFHWLLPTRIAIDVDNFQYDIGGIAEGMFKDLPAGADATEEIAQIVSAISIVNEYEFGCLCGDYDMEVTWDEGDGALKYREDGQFAKAFKTNFSLDMVLPTPGDITALIDAEAEESAYEAAFERDYAFVGLAGQITDTGGLDRAFNMAHAIGQEFKDEPQMAMLAYTEPEAMRDLIVSSMGMMKGMVREELPQAVDWLDAVGAFVKDGGTLSFGAKPSKPLKMADMEDLDPERDPDAFVDAIKPYVTHKK